MSKTHSFHIPVMGIGYTIDSPLKVSQYGIDSVISIVDDILLEKIRKMYCGKYELPYTEISNKMEDFRAKRITSYLNMIKELAEEKFESFKNITKTTKSEVLDYFKMLPEGLSESFNLENLKDKFDLSEAKKWFKDNLVMGSIDVNVMTKVDKDNYQDGEKLPIEYNDAHAALRGYANSDLSSSIILSAGMSPRLYSYIANFKDFFPTENGEIKKKIVLKVSDYRSALIQGKFLAKKGLWVSEYRIESGLNCGGHAFATEGHLLGPILDEFKKNRTELTDSVFNILVDALGNENRPIPNVQLDLKLTVQGGVGTHEEHQFLLDHYQVDSVGWGSPFLLVPEATTIDKSTINQLAEAKESDLYLSHISPLGVPFNSLRNNTKDLERDALVDKGRPGSSCPKKFLALNSEFSEKSICTASRQYQHSRLKALDQEELSANDHKREYDKVIDKSCICVGLGTSALKVHEIDHKSEGDGISICPGPNMAYFSKEVSLKEMIGHIYGKTNVMMRKDRPHLFVKELELYLDYLKTELSETVIIMNRKKEKYFTSFIENLKKGINYYTELFEELKHNFVDEKPELLFQLSNQYKTAEGLSDQINLLIQKKEG